MCTTVLPHARIWGLKPFDLDSVCVELKIQCIAIERIETRSSFLLRMPDLLQVMVHNIVRYFGLLHKRMLHPLTWNLYVDGERSILLRFEVLEGFNSQRRTKRFFTIKPQGTTSRIFYDYMNDSLWCLVQHITSNHDTIVLFPTYLESICSQSTISTFFRFDLL